MGIVPTDTGNSNRVADYKNKREQANAGFAQLADRTVGDAVSVAATVKYGAPLELGKGAGEAVKDYFEAKLRSQSYGESEQLYQKNGEDENNKDAAPIKPPDKPIDLKEI